MQPPVNLRRLGLKSWQVMCFSGLCLQNMPAVTGAFVCEFTMSMLNK